MMLLSDDTLPDDRFPPQPENRPQVLEAVESLRVIREVMERSTRHSSLSGFSGILVGCYGIAAVAITHFLLAPQRAFETRDAYLVSLASVWTAALAISVATDFMVTKSRAVRVGKQVFSKLGKHVLAAVAPPYFIGVAITLFLMREGRLDAIWPYWMMCNGAAICSVGQFSVRPVSFLGWAFVIAGAVSLFLPPGWGLWVIAVSFGGFNIAYGFYTGITRRDW